MKTLSFVIPCYRSEETIEKVVDEIIEVVSQRRDYDYEVIAVNDSSPDNVYDKLKKLSSINKRIKVVNFAKNVGKHSAVLAGYSLAEGDYIVNLDDDFQSPTYELWRLLEPLENDLCDIATAKYHVKKEAFFKRFGSNVNLFMTDYLFDKPKGVRLENFTIMKRFVAKEMVKYRNPYPYLEGLVYLVTKRVAVVEMNQRDRGDDNSSGFTLKKSLRLFINGFTAFSVKPLRLASLVGCVFSLIGFVYGVVIVFKKILTPDIPVGYSSLMVVLLITSGLIMLMLGVMGEYIGRIYICINTPPQYVIKETINIKETKDEDLILNENS